MILRSGKKICQEIPSKIQVVKQQMPIPPVVKNYGWFEACVNEKLDNAPEILKKKCEFCLRQIVEESILRGINIKFDCHWPKETF